MDATLTKGDQVPVRGQMLSKLRHQLFKARPRVQMVLGAQF